MKKAKIRVFGPKKLLISGIFLSGIGGYPPPLTGKIRYVVFEGLPKLIGILLHILPFDH